MYTDRKMNKVGRNDYCPCGSGKKYKHCHALLSVPQYTTDSFLEGMKASCSLTAQILKTVGARIVPGISTWKINEWVHEMTLAAGAYPAPLNYPKGITDPNNPKINPGGFPASVCTSVNEVVCHGVPSSYILKEGDIVNVDVTCLLDGFYGDSSATFYVGQVSDDLKRLTETTREALEIGIQAAQPGAYTIDIAKAITNFAEPLGYSVVRQYTGHGIGRIFHTYPTIVHYPDPELSVKIEPGMYFTVEPMLNMGTWETELDKKDGWTVYTLDRKPSAQFEHTLYITEKGPVVLTRS